MPTAPRAAVFDLDGTLVDNMRFHADAWMIMCKRLGIEGMTIEAFETGYAGKKNDEIFPELLHRELSVDELARLAEEKESLYRELATPHLREVQGLSAFLDVLDAKRVTLAIASAAPTRNRALVLEKLGIAKRFKQIVGAEHAKRGKPHPDLFLAAAKAIDVEPRDCVAFEDAPNGVRAAVAAGMRCVGVVTSTPGDKLLAAGAFATITRYDELPAEVSALF